MACLHAPIIGANPRFEPPKTGIYCVYQIEEVHTVDEYSNITKGNVDFMKSQTRENLMRAFAGESQARNRYTFAAGLARSQGMEVVARVFEFTADQERAHARVFYDLLRDCVGMNIAVDGNYPVDILTDTLGHLRAARHNEYQEWENDYAGFARIADQEGFELIGKRFEMIAGVEKTHGDRFGLFADLLEQDRLFANDGETAWMCLNCGQIIHATMAPRECPICRHGYGYFVRLDMAPWVRK